MQISFFKTPAPHIIIDNVYTTDELNQIFNELDMMSSSGVLQPAEVVGSARSDGVLLKKNNCVWLDIHYGPDIINSCMYKNSRKLVNVFPSLEQYDYSFGMITNMNSISNLVSYYQDSDYYSPHTDAAVFTMLTHFFKEPKKFSGGELQIISGENVLTHECVSNRCYIFMSHVRHAVTPIIMDDKTEFTGNGRYTLSQFLTL